MTLTREDYRAPLHADRDGLITISNSCGNLDARFSVLRSTAPLPHSLTLHLEMSEWCVQPIRFDPPFWLLVIDADTRDYVRGYPIFDDNDGRAFAMQENDADVVNGFDSAIQRLLTPQQLAEPVGYPFLIYGDLHSAVEGSPDLRLDGTRVMITRGVPIDAIFPSFMYDDFFQKRRR